jgi:hypothetical protein
MFTLVAGGRFDEYFYLELQKIDDRISFKHRMFADNNDSECQRSAGKQRLLVVPV